MITHEEFRDRVSRLRGACVRFEHNAHLGQPIRSAVFYAKAGLLLTDGGREAANRYDLDDMASTALYMSKHRMLDRDAMFTRMQPLINEIAEATKLAKATRGK
jgi:hypothetical protein